MSPHALDASFLAEARIGDAVAVGPLQVFPLFVADPVAFDGLVLEEALESGGLLVTEVSEAGRVPELRVVNQHDRPVFILGGELLIGAKQNRIVNASLLVPAGSDLIVDVSCVEQLRWSRQSRHFGSGRACAHSKLRQALSRSVGESLRRSGRHVSDQGTVWSEVERKLTAVRAFSPTASLDEAVHASRPRLARFDEQVRIPDDAAGAAFFIGGRLAGIDLFGDPALRRRLWPRIVGSYGLDVIEVESAAPRHVGEAEVRRWLDVAAAAHTERYPSPGAGESVRLRSKELVGAALEVEKRVLHAEIFPL